VAFSIITAGLCWLALLRDLPLITCWRGSGYPAVPTAIGWVTINRLGAPVRQVEVYDSGPDLRYGPGHEEDQYGGLGQTSLNDAEEDWDQFVISEDAFERVWDSAPSG
jgi:hypothetical protein